jgi:hypothetical protein
VTPSPKQPDPLKDLLSEAEGELSRRLREACDAEARGVSTESTKEIRELEDALLAAAVAAQQTIDVRRHIRDRDNAEKERGVAKDTSPPAQTEKNSAKATSAAALTETEQATTSRLREFTDASGRGWRAWPVTPGLDRRTGSDRRFLGDFQEGWICFEAMDSSARRRLPHRAPNWSQIQASELMRLLERAIDAPVRKPHQLDVPADREPGKLSS